MGPQIRAYVFIAIGLAAAWGLVEDLRRGRSSDGVWTFNVAGNPIGYVAFLIVKLAFVAFGVAELLYCLNMGDDPFTTVTNLVRGVGYQSSR